LQRQVSVLDPLQLVLQADLAAFKINVRPR
jgi:hypothetical protein